MKPAANRVSASTGAADTLGAAGRSAGEGVCPSRSHAPRGRNYAQVDIHSKSAENFFSILKLGVIGTYHHWSAVHIHRYLAEFDFRYSTKDISDRERADISLKNIGGKRLTYRRTDKLAA